MRHEIPVAADATRTPLLIDVDGTLVRGDVSLESFVRIARGGLFAALRLFWWLLRGRAVAKTMAARVDPLDPALLCYREDVLALIEGARARGRPVVLASASHWRNVRRIARHLELTGRVIATGARANLKGGAKLEAIRARYGPAAQFDYVGDSAVDKPIWRAAREGWSVGHVPRRSDVRRLGDPPAPAWRAALRAMRPHQWAKNALVLVPAFTSAQFFDPVVVGTAVAAAFALSLVASAIYLVNDLLDVDADRLHPTKRNRPIAAGALSIPMAVMLAAALGAGGIAVGWAIGGTTLAAWLVVYTVLTTAYSLRLKAVMVGDVLVLASLYTIRLCIGGAAIGVALSFWLLLFSIFLFLSLAYLKRYVEMQDASDPGRLLRGRGYVGGDLDVVMMSGIASGMVSVLVLALFAHGPEAAVDYASPEVLLLLCLPLTYWLNRVWMMARRGEVEGDPVAFAIRDPRSLAVAVSMAAIFGLAVIGVDSFLPHDMARMGA